MRCLRSLLNGRNGAESGTARAPGGPRPRGETIELDGWSEDLGECRVPSDLPKAARDYLRYIEENVGVRVVLVGVGPGREQIIWADESDAVPRAA